MFKKLYLLAHAGPSACAGAVAGAGAGDGSRGALGSAKLKNT